MRAGLLTAALALTGCADGAAPGPVLVFAAASLTDVTAALATGFEAETGARVVVSTGASSVLAHQIAAGAPADVLFSASAEWAAFLAEQGALAGPPQPLAANRLVVLGPPGAAPLASTESLLRLGRIAVADPAHVPAGVYAKASLEQAGLWEAVAPRLLPTLDVRAAVAAVERGTAAAAIAYASDTLAAPDLAVLLAWPEASHPTVRIVGAPVTARGAAFLAYAVSPDRSAVWRRHGFRPVQAPPSPS